MIDPGTAMLVGGGLSTVGSIIGGKKSSDAMKDATAKQRQQFNEIKKMLEGVGIPSVQAQKIILTDPQLVGELIPELEGQAEELSTAMQDVEVDPRLQEAQMEALGSLQERAAGGLTPDDIIAIKQIGEDTSGRLASQDANILQNMEQRGLGGSGMELAMRQSAGQSAMKEAGDRADQLAALNYQAKMDAILQAGNMAGGLRSQSFGEESSKASAMDAMDKFNLANQMGVDQRNVATKNLAQERNLAKKEQLEAQRAANRQQEEIHNKGLMQQDYQNRMSKAQTLAGVQSNMANQAMQSSAQQAANTAQMWSGIGDAAMGAASAYAKYNKPTASSPKSGSFMPADYDFDFNTAQPLDKDPI